MTIYKRLKHGEANFILEERFDDIEKAANSQVEGEFVDIKINNLKIDFTKVIKEKDGTSKVTSAKVQGSPGKETQKVSGDKGTS
jgi:hypothetical protein|tara:strand:- start:370 stop:621 length:252 start_codon:yes stop_codon:yes gene_type:complete